MRIKRFEAKDARTALAMVKEEMGDDAVILATRKVPASRKPLAGRNGGKDLVEVVAAIDYDMDEIALPPVETEAAPPQVRAPYGYQEAQQPQKIEETAEPAEAPPPEPTPTTKPQPEAQRSAASQPAAEIHSEAHDLKLRFANLLRRGPAKKTESPAAKPLAPAPQEPQSEPASKPSPAEVAKWRDQLIDKIRFMEQDSYIAAGGRQVLALVGATGVGKTTTAAKLAAWFSLHLGKRVALLSMDCYRIGATDQLRTYARIMRLPCEVVLKKSDLGKALARHQDQDVVIIDTAGKSPYDGQHTPELMEWFAPHGDIEPHLVVSATTKKEDIQAVLESYGPLDVASLVLTKLDETRAYANLCQQVVASSLPISYLCTGQRVPEDFLVASKDFLDRLFKHGWSAAIRYSEESVERLH